MQFVVFDNYRLGVLRGNQVIDITKVVPEKWHDTPYGINILISNYKRLEAEINELLLTSEPIDLQSVKLCPPLPAPSQIMAAPRNYQSHRDEMKKDPNMTYNDSKKLGTPRELGFFWKSPGSICGPSDAILLPPIEGRRFDHEVELALVIGKEAKGVKQDQAYDYIFGYTCLIDLTMRMTEDKKEERSMRKSFETFTPIGPKIVTIDEIDDPDDLGLRLWVNDELRQEANTRDLTIKIPELMEIASSVVTLKPGDLIATGTPSGIGPIEPGDVITIEVEKVGRMSLPVLLREW